jgi:hypothetical protein
MMILFCDPTGPKLTYSDGVLHVADLNPEIELGWRMTRWDMLKLGWRCIKAAASKAPDRPATRPQRPPSGGMMP